MAVLYCSFIGLPRSEYHENGIFKKKFERPSGLMTSQKKVTHLTHVDIIRRTNQMIFIFLRNETTNNYQQVAFVRHVVILIKNTIFVGT